MLGEKHTGLSFPSDIIQNAVWLYFRFPLSFRDVEDLLAERGIDVSYETVRRWSVKFGLAYARKLRRSHPPADARWHLDEVFVSINGRSVWRPSRRNGQHLALLDEVEAKLELRRENLTQLVEPKDNQHCHLRFTFATDRSLSASNTRPALMPPMLLWTSSAVPASSSPIRVFEKIESILDDGRC